MGESTKEPPGGSGASPGRARPKGAHGEGERLATVLERPKGLALRRGHVRARNQSQVSAVHVFVQSVPEPTHTAWQLAVHSRRSQSALSVHVIVQPFPGQLRIVFEEAPPRTVQLPPAHVTLQSVLSLQTNVQPPAGQLNVQVASALHVIVHGPSAHDRVQLDEPVHPQPPGPHENDRAASASAFASAPASVAPGVLPSVATTGASGDPPPPSTTIASGDPSASPSRSVSRLQPATRTMGRTSSHRIDLSYYPPRARVSGI